MIVFHEGLPRAGKTWEAMMYMALPAIKKGRHVTTNVKGVSFGKIAEILELELETVEALITICPWDSSKSIHAYAKNDGLVILDEVQDFFPPNCKLDAEQTEFITQHGQRGIDIVLCGQSYRNVHVFWRDRIQRLIYFKKLSALGAESRYQWQMQEKSGPNSWAKMGTGVRSYERKYFGVYKSHTDGTTNTGNLQDERAVIWNRPAVRYGIPLVLAIGLGAAWFASSIFTGETDITGQGVVSPGQRVTSSAPTAERIAGAVADSAVKTEDGQTVREPVTLSPDQYVLALAKKYRPRLAAFMTMKGRVDGLIEFRDESYKIREQLRIAQLVHFGWSFEEREGYVLMTRKADSGPSDTIIVTSWPIDEWGRANVARETQSARQQGQGGASSYTPPSVVTMGDVTGGMRIPGGPSSEKSPT